LVGDALGPSRDQGRRGTCLAFAATGAHGVARSIRDSLSVEWLFFGAKQRDGSAQDGTTTRAVREALELDGQPEEKVWPYDPMRSVSGTSYRPPPLNGSSCYTRSSTPQSGKVAEVIAALDAEVPVVLVVSLTEGFVQAANNTVTAADARGPSLGLHGVLAVGHGVRPSDGAAHLIIRNSWGVNWAAGGYCVVALPYCELHLREAFRLN
jgi:hypothetical protein